MTTARCSFRDAAGLPHLCVTVSMRKADIHMSHPVLRVTAMNEKLSVTFLTSDWVLSKLLLFSTHSSTEQAFSIQTCPSERVSARTKMLKSQGWISCQPGGPGKKENTKHNWHDCVWCGAGAMTASERCREIHNRLKKCRWTRAGRVDGPTAEDMILPKRAAWLCQQRKENNQSTQTESEHF